MHPLLRQQLRAHLGVSEDDLPADLAAFVQAIDVTYRHNDEQPPPFIDDKPLPAPHETHARLRSVLRALPDAVMTLEKDGRIVDVHADNKSMPERKVLGRNLRGLLDEKESTKALNEVEGCLRDRAVRQFKAQRQQANGLQLFEVRLAPYDEDSVIAIVRDVTAYQSLHSTSLRSEHAAWLRLAHDINNPLTTVITNLVLISEDTTSPHTAKTNELVSEAIIGSHRIRDVVASLRAATSGPQGTTQPATSQGRPTTSQPTARPTALHEQPPLSEPSMSAKAGSARVLIIEDEPMVARGIARALRSYETVIQSHAEEAVQHILDRVAYDVIICDLMMPGMTGMQVYDAVVAQRPELASRFVFISGGTVDRTPSSFFKRVTNTHLEKPFDPSALRTAVAEVANG
ncbi:MAG: CheY-like chemotaxis protein [Kiritimatiellia bacterium]|jgi:CheY-like chemotaxis protein